MFDLFVHTKTNEKSANLTLNVFARVRESDQFEMVRSMLLGIMEVHFPTQEQKGKN